ncbi:MAG: hypothetical protein QJR03_02580 [Sphaerobacter sp.]|nr:hypothetical protein [Sphaerobacter sp.]
MSKLSRWVRFLTSSPARDLEFEAYYGALLLTQRDGVPSAEEARRDYEPVRRVLDRAVIF